MRSNEDRSKSKEANPYYKMDATRLKNVEHEKDLEWIVDSELKFEDHIKKANSVMGMIRRNFAFLDRDMFKQLFVAMVRPHFNKTSLRVWCYSMEPSLQQDLT